VLQLSKNVRFTHNEEGGVVLDILHGQMYRLNFVGSRMLELLAAGYSEESVAEDLNLQFGVRLETARNDVRDFFEVLEQHALIVRRRCS